MNERVDEEYEKSLLESGFRKWRGRSEARQKWYSQVQRRHDVRILRHAMDRWVNVLKERRLTKWRHDMRRRMAEIKQMRETRIVHDAWLVRISFQPEATSHSQLPSCRNGDKRTSWKVSWIRHS